MNPGRLLAVAAACLLCAPAGAFELLAVESRHEGEEYMLRIEARFSAGADAVLGVLTDYERIHELHPNLLESRSLGLVAPGVEEVYLRSEACVLLFCREMHRVEHIRVEGHTLHAVDVPRRGSFRSGATSWRFTPDGDGALLEYQTRFVPAFEPLPMLGPALLLDAVERMTRETMLEVDRRAMASDD
ncbi:SRPBCC family protein [Thioalkalivibrio sp. XN279]|uniref:SRPBCC family protein n=1 Tax=Thioalkalivibrio sp. XN279 TaxID=2714953 RepID=UPI00140886B5|nr:SRPBCC family protein [Thioalkalivibrio sp. XN279]NHA13530.1 hypothetical protein [Thioalkalivibrio sp. XN279]